MITFLKNFLSGEKSAEEKAILATQEAEKKHDVMTIGGAGATEEDCDEEEQENFSGPCCGGGCRG